MPSKVILSRNDLWNDNLTPFESSSNQSKLESFGVRLERIKPILDKISLSTNLSNFRMIYLSTLVYLLVFLIVYASFYLIQQNIDKFGFILYIAVGLIIVSIFLNNYYQVCGIIILKTRAQILLNLENQSNTKNLKYEINSFLDLVITKNINDLASTEISQARDSLIDINGPNNYNNFEITKIFHVPINITKKIRDYTFRSNKISLLDPQLQLIVGKVNNIYQQVITDGTPAKLCSTLSLIFIAITSEILLIYSYIDFIQLSKTLQTILLVIFVISMLSIICCAYYFNMKDSENCYRQINTLNENLILEGAFVDVRNMMHTVGVIIFNRRVNSQELTKNLLLNKLLE